MSRLLIVAILSLFALPVHAAGLAILHTVLEDNGDDDGFAAPHGALRFRYPSSLKVRYVLF